MPAPSGAAGRASRRLGLSLCLLAVLTANLSAQGQADTYLPRYAEVVNAEPAPDQAAEVHSLILHRDTAQFELESGKHYLLNPIGGRVVGAVFIGKGTFDFTPPLAIERERLRLFRKSTALSEPFTEAVFLFSDSTLTELQHRLTFGPGRPPADAKRRVEQALDYLGDKDQQSLDVDLMRPMLNGESTGLFYAHMARDGTDPWMFMFNPQEMESVQLLTRAKHTGFTRYSEVVTQFAARGDTLRTNGRRERRAEAWIDQYTMSIRLPQTGTGELDFRADATLRITTDTAAGPWLAFYLFSKLKVDSASWEGGVPAVAFKGKDSSILWVRLDKALARGDSRVLRLFYHGDLIDRFGDWFFIKSSISWYPLSLDQRNVARFDLTYFTPEGFRLASVGQRGDSAGEPGHMVRTRWVTEAPIRNASFNLGLFDQKELSEPGIPPVTVLWSDQMHRYIGQGGGPSGGKNMDKAVGGDVLGAMQFYQNVFGEAPVKHFFATEIPYLHGEAWPGIVGLSYVTFHETNSEGYDEVFRAHEVAHQWFGIGVDYATYRDRWLSEGFSNFAGLWYMQTRKQSKDKYFDMLRRWKADIMLRRNDPIPIWLGHRVATASTGDDYSAIVYEKGAYVLHMLRILLLDLKGMKEDRFTTVMREYYTTYKGKAASTEDFQAVVERVTGQKMGWYFDQWVRGNAVPTYRVAWKADPTPDGKFQVKLRVLQEQVPDDFIMYVPVTLDLGNEQVARFRVKVAGPKTELDLPPVPVKPKDLKFNDLEGVLAEVKMTSW